MIRLKADKERRYWERARTAAAADRIRWEEIENEVNRIEWRQQVCSSRAERVLCPSVPSRAAVICSRAQCRGVYKCAVQSCDAVYQARPLRAFSFLVLGRRGQL